MRSIPSGITAIGSEVKVKSTIRTKADAVQQLFVEFILGNPREITLRAIGLFDEVISLVVGKSLKTDNKPVFKALERLFQLRNRVAHKGELLQVSEARLAVSAAVEASHWLDSL